MTRARRSNDAWPSAGASLVLVLVSVLGPALAGAGCAPWYRDDELRALRADDAEAQAKRLGECDAALVAGRAADAVPCFAHAVEANAFDTRAVIGWARSLTATGRLAEARAVIDRRLADLKAGRGGSGGDPAASRELVKLLLDSYARQELYALALERIAELGTPTLEEAAEQFPSVYGALRDAQQLAAKGQVREALDKYAAWLNDYGVPDTPLVRRWSDDILTACSARTADYLALADQAADAKNWVGAVVSYGETFRYWPSDKFEREARRKLIEASAYLADPSMVSPTALELAAQAEPLVQKERVGAALQAYRRAVAAAPHWAEARHNLAVLCASVEMYGEAVRQMDWFLALDPSSPRAVSAQTLRDGWASKVPPSAGEPKPR
jgi:tetratricopeptide (TPR) repeat protein